MRVSTEAVSVAANSKEEGHSSKKRNRHEENCKFILGAQRIRILQVGPPRCRRRGMLVALLGLSLAAASPNPYGTNGCEPGTPPCTSS